MREPADIGVQGRLPWLRKPIDIAGSACRGIGDSMLERIYTEHERSRRG